MDRRAILKKMITVAAATSLPLAVLPQTLHRSSFKLYNALHFKNMPRSVNEVLSDISIVYADQMWPDRGKHYYVDQKFIMQRFGNGRLNNRDKLICLDIEHWPYRQVTDVQLQKSMGLYIEIFRTFKSMYPDYKIGFFEFFPTAFYPLYTQFGTQRPNPMLLKQWREEQRSLQPINELVDVLFPQLYSRWPERLDIWEHCAETVLKEADGIAKGRPIIPFLWPQFWYQGEGLVPGEYWESMLRTVKLHADSAILWSIYRSALPWNPNAAWWRSTVQFSTMPLH